MTTSKESLDDILKDPYVISMGYDDLIRIALDQARDAALEEAAKEVMHKSFISNGLNDSAAQAAAIRALKSKGSV